MSNTIKIDHGNALLVAHRGVSGLETENTVAAFVAAGNRSYYGVETDIHLTKDGKFVCSHDPDTGRLGNKKLVIKDHTYGELLGVKLVDNSRGGGQREDLVLPLLEDYISICKHYGKHCVLELKEELSAPQIEQLFKIIDGLGHLEQTTFISFHPNNIFKARDISSTQSCQFLCDRLTDEILSGVIASHADFDLLHTALNEDNVKMLKDKGLKINCWTVDDPARAAQLIGWGVDYITTNILE